VALGPCYPSRAAATTGVDLKLVEIFLFVSLLLTSIGLVTAILMQSRGSGLGATFGGGDSSTFRSRRGVEARLYQFTVVLAVAFVGVAMLIFIAE
jgi:protein translocase SecG subunit